MSPSLVVTIPQPLSRTSAKPGIICHVSWCFLWPASTRIFDLPCECRRPSFSAPTSVITLPPSPWPLMGYLSWPELPGLCLSERMRGLITLQPLISNPAPIYTVWVGLSHGFGFDEVWLLSVSSSNHASFISKHFCSVYTDWFMEVVSSQNCMVFIYAQSEGWCHKETIN